MFSSPTCIKYKAKDVKICAYIFRHTFNEERGYFRKKYYNKQIPEGESRFKCEECGKKFTKACNLNRHYTNQHYGSKFQCQECPKFYTRKDILKQHRRKVHLVQFSESDGSSEDDESELLDSVAETSYNVKQEDEKQRVEYEQDETVIRKLSKLKCVLCGKRFERNYNLKRHIKLMHKVEIANEQRSEVEMETELRCASCEKCFKGKYQLKRHIKTVHDKDHALSCTWCGTKFSRQDYLSKHLKAGLNENDGI